MNRVKAFGRADDALADVITMRRSSTHRILMVDGVSSESRAASTQVLRAIDDLSHEAPPSIGEVATRLGREQSNTSRTIEEMVREGLIIKTRSASDARRIELRFTPEGQSAVKQMRIRRAQVHSALVATWSDEEISSLADLLDKLRASYQDLLEL